MNNYDQKVIFPGDPLPKTKLPNQQYAPTAGSEYIKLQGPFNENIFRANIGKLATFYVTLPDSVEWRDKIFHGVIEAAGRDHILLSDPKTGKWILVVLLYLNYVEFDEPVNYPTKLY